MRQRSASPRYRVLWLLTLTAVLACFTYTVTAAPQEISEIPALELLVLGSGGPGATGRASSSYLVLVDGAPRILVDAGSGAFVRLGESKATLESLDIVLLTHLHVDHAAELPAIIKARAVAAEGPISFRIYGPRGHPAQADGPAFPSTGEFTNLMFGPHGAFAYLKNFSAPVTLKVTDLPKSASQAKVRTVVSEAGLKISAVQGHHGDAPAVIYRIDYRGRSIVFSGDVDRRGLPALGEISQNASLLVFDAVVLDPPDSPEVLYSLHSPPKAIAPIAAHSHVGTLLLSHLSPAVDANRKAVAASIAASYAGLVTFAEDGLRLKP